MRFASLLDNSRKWIEIACLTLLLTCISSGVWGEPVTTIRNNGDPSNRLDLVILGDGYTTSELGKYATDVETFVQGLFTQEPFREYQRFFNVHRVDVTSNESGADHPERNPPVYKDTAFDAAYNCNAIQRLICVNTSKVNTVVSNSVPADSRDVILVVVNDTEYGGAGGAVAVTSINQYAVELILHELGHTLGLLGDEYDSSPPPCVNNWEPSEPNVTRETNRNLIKWNVGGGPPNGWINLTTPIPTTSTTPGVPGLYQGARYCLSGLYRPTYNSKMRSILVPFEQINSEQLVKRFYNWVAPIDTFEPSASNITLPKGQNQTFRVSVPQPFTHNQNISWKLDDQILGTGNNFTLNSSNLTVGIHTVEVVVIDPTSFVRNDPMQVLRESWRWNVAVTIPVIDFNGDGNSDLAGLTSVGTIYYTTNLQTWTQIPGVLEQLVVGDFNGNGTSDLAGLTSVGTIYNTTNLQTWTQIPGVLEQLVVGDFNGNGTSDLAGLTSVGTIYYTTNLQTWTQIPGVLVQLVSGNFNSTRVGDELAGLASDGSIWLTTNLSTWTQIPGVLEQLVVGDFDGNGTSDLAGLTSVGTIYYTTNLQTWTQIPGVLVQLVSGNFNSTRVGDELAGLASDGSIWLTTNLSTWTQIPGALSQLIVGYFNGNGTSDLAGLTSVGTVFYTTDLQTWTQIPGVLSELAE